MSVWEKAEVYRTEMQLRGGALSVIYARVLRVPELYARGNDQLSLALTIKEIGGRVEAAGWFATESGTRAHRLDNALEVAEFIEAALDDATMIRDAAADGAAELHRLAQYLRARYRPEAGDDARVVSKSTLRRWAVQIPRERQPEFLATLFDGDVLKEAARIAAEKEVKQWNSAK